MECRLGWEGEDCNNRAISKYKVCQNNGKRIYNILGTLKLNNSIFECDCEDNYY
ncbi:hypothetical protein HZS_5636, partial [Henneguya salminicola]